MDDSRRSLLRALLRRRQADGMTQREVAMAAGVSQPLVSQAMAGKLTVETEKVKNLFEYLGERNIPEPRPLIDDRQASEALLQDALAKLSDGTVEGNMRLARLLDAIAEMQGNVGTP